MTRQDYLNQLNVKKKLQEQIKNDPFRLGFHVMGPSGWVNDPNGLCQFKGIHHWYFQYTPFTPLWGLKCWGHYTTTDFIHFKEEEPFLYPDCVYDKDGVYSGSAFVHNDEIHYYYTGNVKYVDKDYDYILSGREQNTMHLVSKDGYTFADKQLVLNHDDYPNDMSKHIRDPKVFQEGDDYYMVLGGRDVHDCGLVLLYHSTDLIEWKYHMRIQTNQRFGYMWECPDCIELDGKKFLIICPQGVPSEEYKYQNVYQLGYFPIELDLKKKTYTLGEFEEFDAGFDIYASQTYQDDKGRRIFLAWMGIPDADYHNQQTIDCGWQHAFTIPRQLINKNGKLIQQPLTELNQLRKNQIEKHIDKRDEFVFASDLLEIQIQNIQGKDFEITLKSDITLTYKNDILCLNIENIGNGRTQRKLKIDTCKNLHLYLDRSCLEIFVNDGEKSITSRIYSLEENRVGIIGNCDATFYELNELNINLLEE